MTIDSKYGVPTVAIHTDIFERVVRSVARVNGMPRTRAVFVPQPVMGKSPKELRAYVDGNDPVTGRPVMQEAIEGLTRPFDAKDLEKIVYERRTTSLAAAMVVVNGPVRGELDMSWGIGALGPYNEANATIGRAFALLSQNLQGGSEPGLTYMGSQGNNYGYNCITFAENEERSPWDPFHVQHGFAATDSTVSVFGGCRHTAFTLG